MIFTALNDLAQCSQWAYCFTFKWLVSIYLSILQHAFRVPLKPSTFPSSTFTDLLWVILNAICAAAVFLKYSQYCIAVCIDSNKFLYSAAAATIYNHSNNQQQEQLSSSVADLFCQDQIDYFHVYYHADIFWELSW